MNPAVIYVDGACSNNGKSNARAGIGVWWDDDHPLNVSEPLYGKQTNNRAEIHAAIRGIKLAFMHDFSCVMVCTDSQFLYDSVTKYFKKWLRNDWTLFDGTTVKNKYDFLELLDAMKLITVHWKKVKAHSGIYGNIRADELARLGMRRY